MPLNERLNLRFNIASAAALKGKPPFSFSVAVSHAERKEVFFMKFSVKKIVFIGLMVSISIVLTRLLSVTLGIVRVGFGDVPIIISGMLLGPPAGAFTGVLSDTLGFWISGAAGTYIPWMALSKALVGIIPALIYKHMKYAREGGIFNGNPEARKVSSYKKRLPGNPDLFRIAAAVAVTDVICSMILDTIWLLPIFPGYGMLGLLTVRVPVRVVLILIEIPLVYEIMKRLKNIQL